jgi:hypothetical protein
MSNLLVFSKTLSVFAMVVLFSLATTGCSPSKYLYLKTDTDGGKIEFKKAGLEVILEMSTKSLLDNKLQVINASDKTVSILPSQIHFEIMGTGLCATAVPNFHKFIAMRLARLDSLCGKSTYPDVCASEIQDHYLSLMNKGFPYGTIAPGDTMSGYIALDVPLIISRSKWDKSEITKYDNTAITYMAFLTISFRKEDNNEVFKIPLLATVFNKLEKLPYSVAKNFL